MTTTTFERAPELLPDVWAGHARWRGDRVALVCGERRLTWRAFDARMNRVANTLGDAGLIPGDRVAILMANGVEMMEAMFGALKGGFVAVPLSTMMPPATIAAMVADSGARALIVSPEHRPLAADVPPGSFRPDDGWLDAASEREPDVRLAPDDEAVIIYSSGTTGVPKGIVHTHGTRYHLAYSMAVELGLTQRSTALATTPLYANGTWLMLLPALFTAAPLVVLEKFAPAAFLNAVKHEQVTHCFLVPPQFPPLLSAPELDGTDLSSLRAVLSGGAPFPIEAKRETLRRITPNLFELYGCTEGVATLIGPEEVLERPSSVGRPLIGCEIAVVGDDDRRLGPGEIGEIAGYGPGLMKGYHNRPDATAEAVWRDERGRAWFRTGDVGRLDADGHLSILDRKKDMIVSGGFNVYAADVEQVVAAHPQVGEVAVIGVPDARWGEVPVALVVPAGQADAAAIMAWSNERLAKPQRLARIELRATLPRNGLGKVLKRELREPYWRDATHGR